MRRRLIASIVLAVIAAFLLFLGFFLHKKGWRSADEFSSVAGLFLAIVALLNPLVGRMFSWLQHPEPLAPVASVDQTAEDLARAWGIQLAAQEQIRKINDPWPLPVRWEVIEQLAAVTPSGDRGPITAPRRNPKPSSLKGSFDDIGHVFTVRIRSRRLVVLGEAGAGKSVLVIRLALQLLKDRRTGDPVPALVSVAAWDPYKQSLLEFVTSQLTRDQSGLAAHVKISASEQVTLASALVTTGRLMLILDGLDEILEASRAEGLRRINELGSDKPLVVTSRTAEYQRAARALGRGVIGAEAVELLPLSLPEVKAYLAEATAAGPGDRWKAVFGHLTRRKSGPLAKVLQTPLMIWLTRTIYAAATTNPGELVDLSLRGDHVIIEEHLIDAFVPAVYEANASLAGGQLRWSAGHAQKWLRFLARHLQQEGTTNLAWWNLNRRVPRIVYALTGGIPIGVPIALVVLLVVGLRESPTVGLKYALAAGVVVSLLAGPPGSLTAWRPMTPSRVEIRLGSNLPQLISRLALGLVIGLALGLVVGLPVGVVYGPVYGLLVGLAVGPAIGVALSLRQLFDASADVRRAVSPSSILHDDMMSAIVQASVGGIGIGIGAGIALAVTVQFGTTASVAIGVGYGLAYGLAFGLGTRSSRLSTPAFTPYIIARAWLAASGHLPWQFMDFLDDAHRRGVLRQQGAVYQFRHLRLQQHLASGLGSLPPSPPVPRTPYHPRTDLPLSASAADNK